MKEISRTLCCNSPTYSQAARSLCACPCREAFGVRRISALSFRLFKTSLDHAKAQLRLRLCRAVESVPTRRLCRLVRVATTRSRFTAQTARDFLRPGTPGADSRQCPKRSLGNKTSGRRARGDRSLDETFGCGALGVDVRRDDSAVVDGLVQRWLARPLGGLDAKSGGTAE